MGVPEQCLSFRKEHWPNFLIPLGRGGESPLGGRWRTFCDLFIKKVLRVSADGLNSSSRHRKGGAAHRGEWAGSQQTQAT